MEETATTHVSKMEEILSSSSFGVGQSTNLRSSSHQGFRIHLLTRIWKEGLGYVYCWSKKGKSAYSKDHSSIRDTVEGRATVKVALVAIT